MSSGVAIVPFAYPHYQKNIIDAEIARSKTLLAPLSLVFLKTVFGRGDI
jgi:hypothetical protein